LYITAFIIILAGISLYFLLREPTSSEYKQGLSYEPIDEFERRSDQKIKKTTMKNIFIN